MNLMASRWRSLVLLLVLGMLQGMLPMLHGHVGGQAVRTGAHLPMMALDAVAAGDDAAVHLDSLRAGESPEIGVGQFIERRQVVALSLPEQGPVPAALSAPADAGQPGTTLRPVFRSQAPQARREGLPPPALAPPPFLG